MTRTTSIRLRPRTGLALAAAVIALPLAATAQAAVASSGPGPNQKVPVSSGVLPKALPGSSVTGATAPNTPETVSFVMRERDISQLKASVEHGVRGYLSVAGFAHTYGATWSSISALEGYLHRYKISTSADPDNVDVVAHGTAGEFDRALSISESDYHVPQVVGRFGLRATPAQNVYGANKPAELPEHVARTVLAILGLSNYGPFGSQAVHVNTALSRPQASGSSYCLKLTGLPSACNKPANFASNYGLSSLYKQGSDGSGQTIAIVTLAALDPGAPAYFWHHVLDLPNTGRTVKVVNVDGGPGAPSNAAGTGETDLDTEQSGGLAPGANVIVYQAPNTDYGFADAFFDAASQNIASTVSASWLESETYLKAAIATATEDPAYEAAFDEAFLEMAAQGQSGFIAAGDWGAYTATADLGTTNLSVGASADSPFITAAGGTTLPWTGTLTGADGSAKVNVPNQRTWGWDYLWKPVAKISGESLAASAESHVIGSGGGFSSIEGTPSYQQGVAGTNTFHAVKYLTPTGYKYIDGLTLPTTWSFNANPTVSTGSGSGRAMPDVSTDADPYSGYLLYEPSFAQAKQPLLQGGWGGTSFVAPQLNGSTAVIDSYLGHRMGFWNPSVYALATGSHSPFTPLSSASTSNDNIFYTGNPGQPFNEGSGLGYPNLGALARELR